MEPLTTAALVMGGAKLIGGIGAGVSDIIATSPRTRKATTGRRIRPYRYRESSIC